MSLRVWLPLNGNLENKGLNGNIISSNNYSSNNNGKIGKCIQTNSTSSIPLGVNGNIINSGSISFGGWFKFNKTEISNIISTGEYTSTYKTATGNVLGNDTYGGIALIWQTNDIDTSGTFSAMSIFATLRTGTVNNSTTSISVEFDTWMHLFLIYDKNTNKLSFYKNGTIIGEKSFNTFSDAASREIVINYKAVYGGNARSYNIPFYANDVRIYDHCLSPLEVKEISQGLVLHYPLNGYLGSAPNLLSKYVTPGQGAPGSTSTAGRTNYYGNYGIIIPATENADTYFRLFLNKQLESGKTYTISCNVSGLLSGSYYRFPLFSQSNTSMGVLNLNHNGVCSLTFTMNWTGTQTAVSKDGRNIYVCFLDDSSRAIASGQGPITVTNFKIEEGSAVTPFSPDFYDVGLDTTKIIDCSGYGNDGIISGNLSYNSDSQRYNISTYFGGYPTIKRDNFIFTSSQWSVSAWVYPTVDSSGGHQYIVGMNTSTSTDFKFVLCYYTNKFSVRTAGTTVSSSSTSPLNNWYHVCATCDGTNGKIYVNGISTWSGTFATPSSASTLFIGKRGGDAGYFTGRLNDIRIYATVLSEADIKALYNTSANIDNLGNFHSFEFTEDGRKSIDKNGIAHTSELYEYNGINASIKDSGVYNANEFIEK